MNTEQRDTPKAAWIETPTTCHLIGQIEQRDTSHPEFCRECGHKLELDPESKEKTCWACGLVYGWAETMGDTSHLNTPDETTADLSKTESFTQWLDNKGDSLAAPDSFDQWLRQNNDSI